MKPGDIIIKNTEVLTGLMERRFDPILIQVIVWVAKNYGLRMSESYREKQHMNDLHGTQPVRAIDLSYWVYEPETANKISNEINNAWIYDPEGPLCLFLLFINQPKGFCIFISRHPIRHEGGAYEKLLEWIKTHE
jgi:hypothetical protein